MNDPETFELGDGALLLVHPLEPGAWFVEVEDWEPVADYWPGRETRCPSPYEIHRAFGLLDLLTRMG